MDDVKRRLASYQWPYADSDSRAKGLLTDRILEAARRQKLITYSDLVSGVTFEMRNVNDGRPFAITEWTDLHRAIIGDFLGRISADSYVNAGIFLSAVVVTKDDGTPGFGFANFMRELGILSGRSQAAELECWVREVQKVYEWGRKSKL